MTIYTEMVRHQVEIDSHESDLYVLDCPAARQVIARAGRSFDSTITRFRSAKGDGRIWIEIPLSFDPYWERKRIQQMLAGGVKQITIEEDQP